MKLSACKLLPIRSETGTWYRAIDPQFWSTALQTSHTKAISSRFNEGANAKPQFEILYLAEDPQVALFEVEAIFGSLTTPGGIIPNPRRAWIILNVNVQLQKVTDLTDVTAQNLLKTTAQELTGDWEGYQQRGPNTSVSQPVGTAPTQALGARLYSIPGLEGFLTISSKVPYCKVLVVFPHKLQPGSLVRFSHPATGQTHSIP